MASDLSVYLTALEQDLRGALAASEEAVAPLYQMMQYHLGWLDERFHSVAGPQGKHLRPLICLLSCQSVGGDWRRALPAASAIELIHDFSLIHDDIEDESDLRRHGATVWRLWGVAQAINTGDAMWALAGLSMLRLLDRGYSAGTVLRVMELLHQTCLELCTGQYLDLAFQSAQLVSLADYERMISGKTAALFSASAAIGAILGTADGGGEQVVDAYRGFGTELGLSYQIVDDILGIWGDPAVTGKSAASDLLERKKTLPVLYALHWEQERGYTDLPTIYAQSVASEDHLSTVLALLARCGAHEHARNRARQHCQRALDYLNAAQAADAGERPTGGQGKDAARQILRQLVLACVDRDS